MNNLEKRLQNTERALIDLWTLLKDTVPPAYADNIDDMMGEYFEANTELGGDFDAGFVK